MKKFLYIAFLTVYISIISATFVSAKEQIPDVPNISAMGETVSSEEIALAKGYYLELPEQLRAAVELAGYQIYVTDTDLNTLYHTGIENSWLGCCDEDLKVICIRSGLLFSEKSTLYHEIGHAVNNILGKYSNTPEWQECYEAEKQILHLTADVTNSSEWFAECFCTYLEDPALLMTTSPQSFEKISRII